MAAPNLAVSYGERVEQMAVCGRVTSAGASGNVVGSSSAVLPARWAVSPGTTGVYNIVFTDNFAAFLGAQICAENTVDTSAVYAWTQATRTLTVYTFNSAGTATNTAFAFTANFCDSTAP